MPRLKDQDKINQRQKQAYDFYIGRGYTPAQASGIVGNLVSESNLSINVSGDGGKAYGLAQWHEDRQSAFNKVYGKSIKNSTFEEQLSFVDWELKNSEKGAGRKLLSATTPEQAGRIVSDEYERPQKKYHQNPVRRNNVSLIYKNYADPNYAPQDLSVTDYGNMVRQTMSELNSGKNGQYLPQVNYENIPTLNTVAAPEPEQSRTETEKQQEKDSDIYRQSLERKMELYNFVQNSFQQQEQELNQLYAQQQQPRQQEPLIDPYAEFLSQQQPQFQDGGLIPVSQNGVYDFPQQNVLVPTSGNITMQNVPYPILGTSMETGQKQLMQPNGEYYFPKTNFVLEQPVLQNGGTVYEQYQKITGKDWKTAREEGLTDGTAKSNLELLTRLKQQSSLTNNTVSEPKSFDEAFSTARKELGPNKIFEFQGRKYGTNLTGEKFEPSQEELNKYSIPHVSRKSVNNQNQQVGSVYTTKNTVKLEPEYKDWNEVKKRNQEINSHDNATKIIKYQSTKPDEQYLVVDKKMGRMHLYQGNKEIVSYKVGTGQNEGDEQTRTWVDKNTKKVDWSKGNKTTGAGIYTITGSTSKNKQYSNAPSFNMQNEYGIEVPMAIHAPLTSRIKAISDNDPSNNRVSNGCINGLCHDLEDLHSRNLTKGTKVYVLPDDENNKYVYENGKLNFKSNNPNVNRTVNTLNFKPIKVAIDEETFKKDIFQWNDFNDEKEYETTTKPFVQALQDNKQAVMKAAKINGDVYNEIAKVAFGIYGTESNFGDTHSAAGNVLRATKKALNRSGASSPDYKSKATTYGADENTNSVGLTQIRFSYLNKDEKEALSKVGIKNNTDFLDPKKAAIGTAVVLGVRYNQQLSGKEKQDILANLPKKWNTRSNYAERVAKNSKYLYIKELN